MLWRKVVDRNPLFVVAADKLAAKEYVGRLCPELSIPRTLWVGFDADDIPAELLCGDVWVKMSNACNFNLHVQEGNVDRAALKRLTKGWMTTGYGQALGEWNYAKARSRLFVEEGLRPESGILWDISIRVAAGRCLLGSLARDIKSPNRTVYFLDAKGEPTLGLGDTDHAVPLVPPEDLPYRDAYREAWQNAEIIGAAFDYVRVDFLWDGRRLFAGELTIFPASGLTASTNTSVKRVTLEAWDLLNTYFLTQPQPWPASVYAGALRRTLQRDAA